MSEEFENIETSPSFLYWNENIIIMLPEKPLSPGELQIFPREHYTIIEQVPNKTVSELFNAANSLSTMLFENLNCQGTNIIVDNGVPAGQSVSRVSVRVVPRRENDGLDLMWTPQKFSEEQIRVSALKLEDYTKKIVLEEPKQMQVVQESQAKEIKVLKGEENYKLKQLKRIP